MLIFMQPFELSEQLKVKLPCKLYNSWEFASIMF